MGSVIDSLGCIVVDRHRVRIGSTIRAKVVERGAGRAAIGRNILGSNMVKATPIASWVP